MARVAREMVEKAGVNVDQLLELLVKNAAAEMGKSERAVHGLCRRGMSLLRDRLGSATRFLTSSG